MIKVQHCFLVIACLFLTPAIIAQNESFLGLTLGAALPQGVYAEKDFYNDEAGYAETGSNPLGQEWQVTGPPERANSQAARSFRDLSTPTFTCLCQARPMRQAGNPSSTRISGKLPG